MLKLLIADDEEYTREGLREGINWEELGIGEIQEARNGSEALTIARTYKPDIVLTDIRMPKMDGIMFSRELLEINEDVKIIFMSGYMEVDYLKSAIKMSAIDYIEKPIDFQDVKKAIRKATDKISDKREHEDALREQHEINRRKLLSMLIEKSGDRENEDIEELCKKLEFPMHKKYTCFILWDKRRIESDNQEGVRTEFTEYLSDILTQKKLPFLLTSLEDGRYLVLIAYTDDERYRLHALYNLLSFQNEKYIIGVGLESDGIKNIHNSYMTALLTVNAGYFNDTNRVIYVDDEMFAKHVIRPQIYSEFLNVLKNEPENLREWAEDVFDEFASVRYYKAEQVQVVVASFITSMYEEYPEMADGAGSVAEDVNAFTSFAELREYFMDIADRVAGVSNGSRHYSKLVCDMMDYVIAGYNRVEMNVAEMAEYFHLSASYINVLFKQETGVTLKKYINNYKLEKAKAMLRGKYDKITEIADKCGYANANYFAKVFKDEVGMTPLEYRNSMTGR